MQSAAVEQGVAQAQRYHDDHQGQMQNTQLATTESMRPVQRPPQQDLCEDHEHAETCHHEAENVGTLAHPELSASAAYAC
jgi:hypothetical protein